MIYCLIWEFTRFTTLSLFLTETTCSEIKYHCSSGSCILKKNAKCDGDHDCADQSDEADCGEPHMYLVNILVFTLNTTVHITITTTVKFTNPVVYIYAF